MPAAENVFRDDPRIRELLAAAYPPFSMGQIPQFRHRLQILEHLTVAPGSHVLEIGCGQGDATIVLADAVGESGKITAIDPAPLDYGTPYTLGEAQAHITSTPSLGGRIKFIQSDPILYLRKLPENDQPTAYSTYLPGTAVFIHSLYYFSSREQVSDLFKALAACKSIQRLLIAEHALAASQDDQIPHILAAKTLGALSEYLDPATNTLNIRTLVTPANVKSLAGEAGWSVAAEGSFTPDSQLQDGRWEVDYVCMEEKGFSRNMMSAFGLMGDRDQGKERVLAYRTEMLQKLSEMGIAKETFGKGRYLVAVRCMDTWWGEFTRSDA